MSIFVASIRSGLDLLKRYNFGGVLCTSARVKVGSLGTFTVGLWNIQTKLYFFPGCFQTNIGSNYVQPLYPPYRGSSLPSLCGDAWRRLVCSGLTWSIEVFVCNHRKKRYLKFVNFSSAQNF